MATENSGVPSLTQARLFSTPMEFGLRALFVLDAVAPQACDLQRLVIYDYLAVHSADAGGPTSLHPPTPHRSGELLVKRDSLRSGLALMSCRELVAVELGPTGIQFRSSELTQRFLSHMTGAYADGLRKRSEWIATEFSIFSVEDLLRYVTTRLDRWGGEFVGEAVIRRVTTGD